MTIGSCKVAIFTMKLILTFQPSNITTFQPLKMTEKHLLILNSQQIEQKLTRMAYQILEDNFDETEIVIAGILPSGGKVVILNGLVGTPPIRVRMTVL